MTAKLAGPLKMTAPLEAGISTRDIEGMIHFYTEIVGLKLVADHQVEPALSRGLGTTAHGYRIVRLQTPYGERIKLVQSGNPPQQSAANPYVFDRHGLAYLTFVITDLDELIGRLSAQGVNFLSEGKVEVRPGVFAIFASDPEGNRVEFVEYPDVASYRPDLYRWRQFF